MSSNTAHVAADTCDSRLAAWTPTLGSADADLYGEKDIITGRARDLVRNYPIASGARRTLVDNVIGSQLKLSAQPVYRLLAKDKDWAHDWGNQWEAEFATWGNTTECDIARSQDLLGLTRQAVSGAYVNGDHFAVVQWQPRPDARWSTRLQSVEADRVMTPPFKIGDPNIRDGIEVDDNGAPVAYWIAKRHPGDLFLNLRSPDQAKWRRVPAFTSWGRRRVLHLFDKERAGQTRGKTVFATVMRELKIGWDYLSSELQAAAVNSLIAFFLESDLSQDEVAAIFGANADNSNAGREKSMDDRWQEIAERMHKKRIEGGMITSLPLGAKIRDNNFSRPNTSFDPFMEVITRYIGVGLNMPFELIGKNFSKTNYSSARAALAEAWRFFTAERGWIEQTWITPIVEAVLEEAMNAGRIDAPGYYDNKYAYCKSRFIYSGRGAIDPLKEANAVGVRMQNRTTTLEDVCADAGADWEDVLEQQKREEMKLEELGLSNPYQAAAPLNNGQPQGGNAGQDDPADDPNQEDDANA